MSHPMPQPHTVTRWSYRYKGRPDCISLGAVSVETAKLRLAHLRAGVVVLPDESVETRRHFLKTGQSVPPPKPSIAPPTAVTPAPRPPVEAPLREAFDWALAQPERVARSEANRAADEADHLTNLRRAVRYLGCVIDLDRPGPLTQADLQRLVDWRQHRDIPARLPPDVPVRDRTKLLSMLQPTGRCPGRKTLREDALALKSMYDEWLVHEKLTAQPKMRLKYPSADVPGEFRTVAETLERVECGRLTGEEARRAWHESFPTIEEAHRILAHVAKAAREPWLPAVVAWGLYTGARASEIRRARVEDWAAKQGVWEARERKRKSNALTRRSVPVLKQLSELVAEWLRVRPSGSPYLFCRVSDSRRRSGQVIDAGNKLGRNQIWGALKRAVQGSEFDRFPGMHRFRHGYRSAALGRGQDHETVDAIVGHSTAEMRKRYSHLGREAKRLAAENIFGEGDGQK